MVWVIVVVAIVVLGLAAWAGTGRMGEMPEVVNDRPKGHIPTGPVDAAFVEEVRFPIASTGYDRKQVDDYLAGHVAGTNDVPATEVSFDPVRSGYDMQLVDAVLERIATPPATPSDEELTATDDQSGAAGNDSPGEDEPHRGDAKAEDDTLDAELSEEDPVDGEPEADRSDDAPFRRAGAGNAVELTDHAATLGPVSPVGETGQEQSDPGGSDR